MTGTEARARVKAGGTLAQLPQVREAALAGEIRLAHVMCFSAGITKAGLDVMIDAQPWLDARSAPRDANDGRTASQRRIDALADLFGAALAQGLPTDKGVRPSCI